MPDSVMKYGAQQGGMNFLRRWIAKISARSIRIFPVPGAEIFRIHTEPGSWQLAANPRKANVLLVMGDLAEPLAQKAAVAYAQIPRPRVLVFTGPERLPYLPKPDISVALADGFLEEALPDVHQLLQKHAWSTEAEPWEPDFLTDMLEDSENGNGHHHHHDHENNGEEEHPHNNGKGQEEHNSHEHSEEGDKSEDDASHEGHSHNHDDDDADDEGGHDDMDFMSMVAMTKDLPRPKDGLPMNRSEVRFGPFHPGLPGGLCIYFNLDGDTVAEASIEHGLTARNLSESLPMDAWELPDFLSALNPLSPQSYRLAAQQAFRNISADETATSPQELLLLEKERIASHLNWLATFANTIGNNWMHQKATAWLRSHKKEEIEIESLHQFLDNIRNMPYLRQKLTVGGTIPEQLLHHLSGPVAKAAGLNHDARSEDKLYQQLGWEPVTHQGNSPWERLLIRLDEMEQSIYLMQEVEENAKEQSNSSHPESGKGTAAIESPRGTLFLDISIEDGQIAELTIKSPSKMLAGLVGPMIEEAELSDALVAIASLDISPWEIELNEAGGKL